MTESKLESRLIAIVSGLVAFVCFVLTPFLPVNQVQSSLSWPQNGSLASVNAPLISLAPDSLEVTVPVSAIGQLREGQSLILGTLPESSQEAADRGLFVTSPSGGIVVNSINKVILELEPEEVSALPADARVVVTEDADGTSVSVPGTSYSEETSEDLRPQVTGIYTELAGGEQSLIDAGLSAQVQINSRFTSSPSAIKLAVMILGALSALVALYSLYRLDGPAERRRLHFRGFKPLDGVVLGVLGFWHVFGANTSDDGFLLTMARVANNSDYMANYYRWYGVPESPFGSPFYDLLSLLARVSTASMWMRLPTLLAGVAIWWILSRQILPRLGEAIAQRRVAYWTAAFVFLAFWLPYNNGTRPEPIIALGLIGTWACFERAIASQRLFPAAAGTLLAAFTLACGPTGLTAVGVFLISLPALFTIMRSRPEGPLTYIAPFLGVGTAVMIPVFHDQTLAAVLEATSVRAEVGPALKWFEEWTRYSTLFEQTVDGSMARRFPMFVFIFSVALILWALTRYGKVPGTSSAPVRRLVAIVALSAFFFMFTPTKWTHHFGVFAGIGGAAAAVAAVVLSRIAMRSARNRWLAIASVMFILTLTLAGWNGWWYVSSFGVPWWDITVQYHGHEANTLMLALTLLALLFALLQGTRPSDGRWSGVMAAPLAIVAVLMVAFSCLTFLKAFISQAPAYSVSMGNVRTFAGNSCALGADVLLETNTNDSFLTPIGVALGDSLDSGSNRGFDPQGVPGTIIAEKGNTTTTDARSSTDSTSSTGSTGSTDSNNSSNNTVKDDSTNPQTEQEQSTTRTETQGNRSPELVGPNGSIVRLPFNLDYARVPVLGTYAENPANGSELETSWYELPQRSEDAPLLVASVAGRIAHHDIDGVEKGGTTLKLEYGTRADDGSVTVLGEAEMLDQGPTPSWRNVRLPLEDLPAEANVVRLVGEDSSLDVDDWLAVTPPRVPTLAPLNSVISSDTPGLLDWTVAFQYPCQRTFNHYAGVAEIPQFRIMPDAPGKKQLSGFMDFLGGGALSTAEAVNYSYEIPGYLKNDWQRDWGSIAKYELRTNSVGEAPALATVDHETVSRSGLWSPGHMKVRPVGEDIDN
ncbi:putative arabinosyltransferase C [Corynebacterium capitovis DSM 44611]|uniref:arabinosyltransferase domain-containing protein n=1 Tax=Corynebacterium capitovis TaxID=131081 RepID=UPI0003782A20|nr:arabinosyltransferase domain-containing protein [Corynebacterium capitovis]WKD56655.1 putative arabinosyltransferase C [Corynebacterium capitovis DSM 44611]